MERKKIYFINLVLAIGLMVAFNNCTQFAAESDFSSSASQSVCEGQLKAAFQRTYHPFLRANCNNCHGDTQGSSNLGISFDAFMDRGENLIDYQSTHAHGGNSFSAAVMQPRIDAFKPSWTNATRTYVQCIEDANNGGNLSSLRTVDKAIPNIMPTADNNNWANITWDLETESQGAQNGKYKVELRVEAKLNRVGGVISGLFIRNPTMRLKSTVENISVSGLYIYIDGVKQTAVTTYIGVSKIISLTTPVNLVDGSGAAYATYQNFMATTQLGFEISEINTTTEMPDDPDAPVVIPPVVVDMPDVPIPDGGVRHSQLVSNNSPYRVFNRSCVGCHGNGGRAPNLTDYATASAAATLIIQRMNSTANPMPPTGILRQNDRDLVQSWVNSGMPQ